MKKIVLTFGFIAAAILVAEMLILMPMCVKGTLSLDHAEVIGYSSMILSFLMVFFGIRSYRENVGGGTITFGRAFSVGILIALMGCAAYVISWEIYYFNWGGDFIAKYTERMLADMRADGATPAEIANKAKEAAEFAKMYENPLINVGVTFMEVFPVGLVMTLLSAAILRKKTPGGGTVAAVPA